MKNGQYLLLGIDRCADCFTCPQKRVKMPLFVKNAERTLLRDKADEMQLTSGDGQFVLRVRDKLRKEQNRLEMRKEMVSRLATEIN